MKIMAVTASNVRRSECIGDHPGVDVDVTVTLPGGRVVEGEVTLCPAEDGRPRYESWGGSVDCWVSDGLLSELDILRNAEGDPDDWRAAIDAIESAASEAAGQP